MKQTISRVSRAGFTLIEVIVSLVILVGLLIQAYMIFNNSLKTAIEIERLTLPGKIGDGILSLMQRDLYSVTYRGLTEQLNDQVFMGMDEAGTVDTDRLFFISTVDPTPIEEDFFDWSEINTLTVIGYFLEPNPDLEHEGYILYRKEITDFVGGTVLDAPGRSFVVYDKVASLDFKYFDGYDWLDYWSSESKIAEHRALVEEEMAASQARNTSVPRVTEATTERRQPARGAAGSRTGATGRNGELTDDQLQDGPVLAAPIPGAVRMTVQIYTGEGNKLHLNAEKEPVVHTFTGMVQLAASIQGIKMEIDEESLNSEQPGGLGDLGSRGGADGDEGDEDASRRR